VPIPESFAPPNAVTYNDRIGRMGKRLSTYVPPRMKNAPMHEDPEFLTYTYGDPTTKRYFLLKLAEGDQLVFYAGLQPFATDRYREALYIIGYFPVKQVIDFNSLSKAERDGYCQQFSNNAHLKRQNTLDNLVIVAGNKHSRIRQKALLISEKRPEKRGRLTHALSSEMEDLLGISGFIQRSIPPRFVSGEHNVNSLINLLESS